ncbi:RNA dependent RNA polymerase-domain-containing protein [Apodospora peruviana]|uniref:RNA-dependent RNA polymerase n=1 Tax=Apodospora peruviana TaxID=516989 RepID=A0AAE0M837_9PEZI|nr:RNA dependent RNA polymerase-domain-containing protein [Apodospora peruviana]
MAAFARIESAAPTTPRKKDDTVVKIIQRLNDDYGLQIEVPDHGLTPKKRKELAEINEEYASWDRICRGIQFLQYQPGGSLERALETFYGEVKAASQRWVSHDRTMDPPKATMASHRWQMETILLKILDMYRDMHTSSTSSRSFSRSHSGPSPRIPRVANPFFRTANGPPAVPSVPPRAPSPQKSVRQQKRPSLETDDQHAKRMRSTPSPASSRTVPVVSILDSVPSRRRALSPSAGREKKGGARHRILPQESAHHGVSSEDSSNRSNVSLSRSIFDEYVLPDTQTTVDASQEGEKKKKRMPRPAIEEIPRSEDSYPVSLRELHALHESFSRNELQVPGLRKQAPRVASVSRPSHSSPTLSTVYSSIPFDDIDMLALERDMPVKLEAPADPSSLKARLENIWPVFPHWLHNVPFGIAWELTRICLHCNVDLNHKDLHYDPAWATQRMMEIWKSLREHDLFRGKPFPEKPSAEAFAAAALGTFESKGNAIVLSATLDFNPEKTGPLFLVDLKPLKLDQGCRLTRRFGPDRFFEILIPSPTAQSAPAIVKEGGSEQVIRWLTQAPHSLVGRKWQAFYTKDAGYRKPAKEFRLGPDAKPVFKDRVHFFAEGGHNFLPAVNRAVVPADEPANQRSEFKVSQMLNWLLEIEKNEEQPHLKLFSRIQLGLSKTFPSVVFEPGQIINQPDDIKSPIGKVMNDGIGRMSRNVARKIRDVLGISDIPSAVQGRLGPAKGMWLMDVRDTGDEDWIETYPSQRKWNCDCLDVHQRTLEVRSVASELKSAGLNLQFLPVFEDRAKDKAQMRQAIATRLTNDLQRQFDGQKEAFKRPIQFRQWMIENFNSRSDRVNRGHVPFLAGLPENKGEIMNFLLNSGFDPKKQKYLQESAWELQKQKCDILKTKLNIKVGRSAYIYMVIDFWGVLEENEVHIGFSNKFRDEMDGSSYTLVADCDVLVARSPAHFVSDVQKVRAVFKSELHALKDVIVFSAKGNIPLADKLSGGDYDGDIAWVCWDPDIVDSFVNADVPEQPDLSRYMRKDKTTFGELVQNQSQSQIGPFKSCSQARDKAVYEMIGKSFQFAMQPNLLGICTNFKERLCYHNNSVSNRAAVILSTLVGNLVDQSKQGIIFNEESWNELRKIELRVAAKQFVDDPAYKSDVWTGQEQPRHIIDYLKFCVAKPAIDRELQAFHEAMNSKSSQKDDADAAHYWDPDLASYYENFYNVAETSKSTKGLLNCLKNKIGEVDRLWKTAMGSKNDTQYPAKVIQVYEHWRAITPRDIIKNGTKVDSRMVQLLEQAHLPDPELSTWALLKASTAFKMYYNNNYRFVWQMAGRQLAFIKALMVSRGDDVPALSTALMYAGMAPDRKFVKQYTARLDGDGSQYPDPEDAAAEFGLTPDGDGDGAGGNFGGYGDY